MISILRCDAILALACVMPSLASAQQIPGWTDNVKLGRPLYLTLRSGARVEGLAGSVTEDGIAIATPVGVKTTAFADIRRAQRRDGPWNGILIGAAMGLGVGIAGSAANDGCSDTAQSSGTCGENDAFVVVAGAVDGALIGWAVDTMFKGRSTLFDDAGATKIAFVAGPHGVSGRVSLRW